MALRWRLNQESTVRLVPLSTNCVEPLVNTAPTSVRLGSPDLISTPKLPAVVSVTCAVAEFSSVKVPALFQQ